MSAAGTLHSGKSISVFTIFVSDAAQVFVSDIFLFGKARFVSNALLLGEITFVVSDVFWANETAVVRSVAGNSEGKSPLVSMAVGESGTSIRLQRTPWLSCCDLKGLGHSKLNCLALLNDSREDGLIGGCPNLGSSSVGDARTEVDDVKIDVGDVLKEATAGKPAVGDVFTTVGDVFTTVGDGFTVGDGLSTTGDSEPETGDVEAVEDDFKTFAGRDANVAVAATRGRISGFCAMGGEDEL